MSNDDLFLIANAVKDAVVDGYDTLAAGDPELALGARQLVTPGRVVWDCKGLYVQVARVASNDGNLAGEVTEPHYAAAGHALRFAEVGITILRCVPNAHDDGTPPKVADEEAAAGIILSDAGNLTDILLAAQAAGELPGCYGLAFLEWASIGPDGGLAGGTLRVRIQVGF